jgi:hypothetical protein
MNYFQVDLIATLLVLVTPNPSLRFAISTAGNINMNFKDTIFPHFAFDNIRLLLNLSAVFIAFGGLVCLIFIPKVFSVEFEGDRDAITITTKKTLATPGSPGGTNNLSEKLLPNSSSR